VSDPELYPMEAVYDRWYEVTLRCPRCRLVWSIECSEERWLMEIEPAATKARDCRRCGRLPLIARLICFAWRPSLLFVPAVGVIVSSRVVRDCCKVFKLGVSATAYAKVIAEGYKTAAEKQRINSSR